MIGDFFRRLFALGVVAISLLCVMSASGQTLARYERSSVLEGIRLSEGLVLQQVEDERMGNQAVLRLSLDEAVEMALEQNLDIRVQRLSPLIQDISILDARSAWAPTFSTTLQNNSQVSPSTSQLSGGLKQINTDTLQNAVGITQLTPWGGNYSVNWDGNRQSTSSFFTSFNPALRSTVSVQYVQPLLRNLKIDNVRQRLQISRTNRDISDIQLRDTITSTLRQVKNAYWELSAAIATFAVQQQSLELAEESLRNNRTRVEVGTMAPIDIVEAEAEVARNEEAVIVAEALIEENEDVLRTLIMEPSAPNFWSVRLEPSDTARLHAGEIDIDAAVANALSQRTDITQIRRNLDNADTNIRYYENQRLPDLNFQMNYSATAAGGTKLTREGMFGGDVIGRTESSFGSVMRSALVSDFPTWTFAMTLSYPLGTSTADANLARSRLERTQTEVRIRTAELRAAQEVRRAGRNVNTNIKRVDATRVARQLAEDRLEAEQKKFNVGMSTSFLVFQAQRDLADARNSELGAVLDYNQAFVDFEAVQEISLTGGGGSFTLTPGATSGLQASGGQLGGGQLVGGQFAGGAGPQF